MRKSTLWVIWFVIQWFSPTSWGYPVFDYNPTQLKKKFPAYQQEIVPQLKNIQSDVLYMVTKFGNLTEKMVQIFGEVGQINLLIKDLAHTCPATSDHPSQISDQANPACDQLISLTYQKLTEIEVKVLDSLNLLQKKREGQPILSNQQVNTKIELMGILTGIQEKLYRLVHIFEFFIFSNYTKFSFLESRKEIPLLIHDIQNNTEFMIVVAIDEKFRENFDQLWNLYIKPIQRILALAPEPGFNALIAGLESLNMAWNNFHMNLAKGHLGLPDKTPQLILLIHNRWNNILKSLL